MQASIRKLAGPRKSTAVSLRAEATITRQDDGELHLRLVLHAGNMLEERSLDGRSCSALAGATAVAVALLFRSGTLQPDSGPSLPPPPAGETPRADEQPSGSPDQPAKSTDPPVADPKPPEPPPKKSADSLRRWRVLARLPVGLVGIGPVRASSLGVGVAAGVSLDQWRLMLRGVAWLPENITTNDGFQQFGAENHRTTVTLLTCRALLLSRLELDGCATLSLQHLSARGQGAHIAPRTAQATWAAVGLGGQARVHVASWLGVVLGVEGEIEASHPHLFLDDVGPVTTLMPAAATISLGPELIF